MIELLDLYTANGERTGRTAPRGTPPAPGELYLVVHVWIRDEAGRYLIQQRAHHLPDAPGIWAVTAGHLQAGEDSLAAALRETREEVGLALADGATGSDGAERAAAELRTKNPPAVEVATKRAQ